MLRFFRMTCDGHIIVWDTSKNIIQNLTTREKVCDIDNEGAEMVFDILSKQGECTEIK